MKIFFLVDRHHARELLERRRVRAGREHLGRRPGAALVHGTAAERFFEDFTVDDFSNC